MSSALQGKYDDDIALLDGKLRVGASFDILNKKIKVADKKATLYCVDGFVKE